MGMNNSHESNDEPNPKRPKIESEASTSPKPKAIDPFLSLPSDILVKIIGYISVTQWPSLELVDKNFRATTLIAYRQLRHVSLVQDFIIKSGKQSPIDNSVNSILLKLVECSPYLSSIGGIHLRADMVPLLAQFEHLQSICLGDPELCGQQEIQLHNVVAFFESTLSRTSLKELRLFNIVQRPADRITILDRFATSFVNGRDIQSPLRLEKFTFASERSVYIRLDTMDTTRLTDVRLGMTRIEPQHLTRLIERAPCLRRIELSFMNCRYCILLQYCGGTLLQANKDLLAAISSRENWVALKFDFFYSTNCACTNFVPEFIQMLKDIGQRGQLRRLAMEKKLFDQASRIEKDEICATISTYLQCLQSIKLHIGGISHGNVCNIVGMPELEEIDLHSDRVSDNAIKKIAQLPRLRRLALHRLRGSQNPNALKLLADVTTLKDLRIGDASKISGDVWEKWADGFASNLECFMVRGIEKEHGLIRLLDKAVGLRVLILQGNITNYSLQVVAKSCPVLETLGVKSDSSRSMVRGLQEIVQNCTKFNRFGGFKFGVSPLQMEKYRKIVGELDTEFWNHDFDDVDD